MLKDFDEFVRFCFEHGGTLRNHKKFGEMARELRAQIEAAQHGVQSDVAYWLCPQCEIPNVSQRLTCYVCNTPRH